MQKQRYKYKGYISLVSVVIITFAGVAIVATMIWLATGAAKTSLSLRKGEQAKSLANLCAEVALNEIKLDSGYVGGVTMNFAEGDCEILAITGSTLQTTGTVDTVVRKVEIEIATFSPQVTLTSWQEVADF